MNKLYRVWRGPTFAAGLPCWLDSCARSCFSTLYPVFHSIALHPIIRPFVTTLGLFSCLLVQYVALRTATQHEVELHLVKELHSKIKLPIPASSPPVKSPIIDPGKDKLRILGEGETLEGLASNNLIHGYLVITPRIFIYMRYANKIEA